MEAETLHLKAGWDGGGPSNKPLFCRRFPASKLRPWLLQSAAANKRAGPERREAGAALHTDAPRKKKMRHWSSALCVLAEREISGGCVNTPPALISLVKNVVKGGRRGGGERQTRWLMITLLIYCHVCFFFLAFYSIFGDFNFELSELSEL